jgi:hypothetical protein
VAINRFATDTDEEHQVILDHCQFMGVQAAIMDAWANGGAGAEELAELVAATADRCTAHYKPLYDWKQSVREKIEIIATRVYGAASVEYAPGALLDLDKVQRLGLEHLPVCIAKTQSSLSDSPSCAARPRDFVATIREVEIASGGGFLVPMAGNMMRMPGLPEDAVGGKNRYRRKRRDQRTVLTPAREVIDQIFRLDQPGPGRFFPCTLNTRGPMTRSILTLIFCLLLTPAMAAKDAMVTYPLFTVLDGFTQKSGKAEKFAAHTFKTGPAKTDTATVEGRYYDLRYTLNKGEEAPGKLHVIRNFGEAVKQVGARSSSKKTTTPSTVCARMTRKYG